MIGLRRLRQAEVTSEMGNWAWAVGARLHWQIGATEGPHKFGALNVIAAVEIHHDATPSNPTPHDHPGVSLFDADSGPPIEHPPVSIDVVEGVDVSAYQRGANFRQIAESGRKFAYVKITEGVTYRDPCAKDHWQGAGDNGMRRGGYLFMRARDRGKDMVDHYMSTLPFGSSLPHVIDAETLDGQTPSVVIGRVAECVEAFNDLGHRPMVYTMPGFWNILPELYALQADLWVAHWGVQKPAAVKGWDHPLFWQYSATADVPGYPGHADVNRFYGTLEQLDAL